eukprot:s3166_g1.t1
MAHHRCRTRLALLASLAAVLLAVQRAEWATDWTSAFVGVRPVKAGHQVATCRRASEDELPEAPEGGRVIHVEYCMYCKFLPQYLKFRKAKGGQLRKSQ